MSGGYGSPPAGDPSYRPSQEDRLWATLAHVGSLLAAVLAMAFLAPLLVLLLRGSSSPFVRRHAVESLNFQITLLILLAVGILVSIFTLGIALLAVIPAGVVIGVAALVLIIVASVRANNGEDFRYPMTLRLVR